MPINLERLQNAVTDIKEGWNIPTIRSDKVRALALSEYNGMCEGLDMLLKHFQELEENKYDNVTK